MEFNQEDLQELNALADRMEALFDSLENTFGEWRNFCRTKKNLTDKQIQENFQKLIDKGLIPGVYFKKFDSTDIFQIKGISSDCYIAINVTVNDGTEYKMPLTHYITGRSLADKYAVCEAPQA